MVAVRFDRAAAQAAGARDDEAVVGGLDVRAEPAQAVDDGRDPVGLLDLELLRAGDDRLALGEAAEQRDERQLVDRERDLVRLDRRADERAGGDVELGRPARRWRSPRVCGVSRSPITIAPMRSAIRTKPVRVQFALMSVITIREPLTRIAAAMWNAAEDGSPGTWMSPSSSSSCWVTLIRSPSRAIRTPARASSRSVWSRLGSGSITVVVPSASSPAISTHDLTCAEATGSVYSIPRSGMPCTVNGAKRLSVASIHAPISRSGFATRSTGRRRIDASPSKRPLAAGLAGQPAGREPHQRAGVADVDVRLARGAQARAADRQRAGVGALLDQRAARAHGVQRRVGVGGLEVAGDADRLVAHRAEQRGPV